MIIDVGTVVETVEAVHELAEGVTAYLRETDICGHLREETALGVILTEVELEMIDTAKRVVANRVRERLAEVFNDKAAAGVEITFMIFPEADAEKGVGDTRFYPEATMGIGRGSEIAKRLLDVVGAAVGLLLFFPFFAVVPALIKASSRGPVFFRQQRVGRNGERFELLKFRSMYLDNDDLIHRKYVESLIRDGASAERKVYKIQRDPRVTPLGRFLRKYSIDELPQFINVLKGDMSLVGPRPPILYEVNHYFLWQRNRLMGRKPGITGLWQVTGRSATSFDDMVRLDLRYLRGWSLLRDVKILLRTPRAVIRCKGAY